MSSLASPPAETYECGEAFQILNSTDITVRILGSCNGLLCVYSTSSDDNVYVITIWNPSSNEYKQLPRPSKKAQYDIDYYGFGYDYRNDDYKVVRAIAVVRSSIVDAPRIVDYFLETRAKSDVEVYSLRSDSWKNIDAIPYCFPSAQNCGVIVNGAIHWIGVGIDHRRDTIVAFDISEETFKDFGILEGPMIQPPEIYDEDNNNNLGVLGGCFVYTTKNLKFVLMYG
ncbi:F-box/kelch-repeat protein At3g06240-like [Papaver somniferum]|uniref:F-box/kelch-repeat protein At3g06240-like n=1 Tax=Papaver somniferum TaxID=3469 RepID=UPI000E6F4E11|nr:F-box/kelch-repeat protein At3g06240-like [Papaver somniferum]